tara:strand:+ start:758 stop:1030 length:273 start_codon:yes stop_codon:yes gene_type:complete
MYGQLLLKALSDKYNAEISDAMVRLNMCLGTPQTAPDGTRVIEQMDALVTQAMHAEHKLLALQRYTSQSEPAPAPPAPTPTTTPNTKKAE